MAKDFFIDNTTTEKFKEEKVSRKRAEQNTAFQQKADSQEMQNEPNANPQPRKSNKWLWLILIIPLALIGIFFLIMVISLIVLFSSGGNSEFNEGNVAVIPIKGVIVTDAEQSLFSDSGLLSSTDVIKDIERAESDPSIKAIIFEINSPGGSGVASDEIAAKIKPVKKPTVAWIRELGASGAYWVASSTDHVISHRMSFVGSIGVIASYLEFSGLMEKYGVGYERLVAGKYKDMGTPLRELTPEERQIIQNELDAVHAYFIEEVAKNRNLSVDKIKEIADGRVFIGIEAQKFGLIDELGSKQEAINYVQNQLNITVSLVEYKKPAGFFDIFKANSDRTAFYIGKGIGTSLFESKQTQSLTVST